MKKLLSIIVVILLTLSVGALVGCEKNEPLVIKESDTYIVITVSSEQTTINDDTTLADYMSSLKEDGLLDYETSNGMIVEINGIENPADWSSCWMLYTDDTENSNNSWGEVEYENKTYGSAVLGAEMLVVKNGCKYIWVYQSF